MRPTFRAVNPGPIDFLFWQTLAAKVQAARDEIMERPSAGRARADLGRAMDSPGARGAV